MKKILLFVIITVSSMVFFLLFTRSCQTDDFTRHITIYKISSQEDSSLIEIRVDNSALSGDYLIIMQGGRTVAFYDKHLYKIDRITLKDSTVNICVQSLNKTSSDTCIKLKLPYWAEK